MTSARKRPPPPQPDRLGETPDVRARSTTKQVPDEGSLADRAYRLIRSDILNGHLKAGQPLRLEALKARYGLSFSPLREALNRIQSERLVSLFASRGFRVTDISREDMWDTIETRILVETNALERSIARGGDEWEGAILSAFYSLELCAKRLDRSGKASSADELEQLEQRHRSFHYSLISACQSPWLIEFSSQLYAQTERYRRPHLSVGIGTWAFRDVAGEHETIMQACLARDPGRAGELLSDHYRRTGLFIERNEWSP